MDNNKDTHVNKLIKNRASIITNKILKFCLYIIEAMAALGSRLTDKHTDIGDEPRKITLEQSINFEINLLLKKIKKEYPQIKQNTLQL